MSIESRVLGMPILREELKVNGLDRNLRNQMYETWVVNFDDENLSRNGMVKLQHEFLSGLLRHLKKGGFSYAVKKSRCKVPFFGPSNWCYVLRHPDLDVESHEEDAVALQLPDLNTATIKVRFRMFEKQGVLSRLFGNVINHSNDFHEGVKSYLALLEEKAREARAVTYAASQAAYPSASVA